MELKKQIRPIEIFLVEVVIYIMIWISNDYLGSLLSLIFGSIFLAILLISLIVEWVEPSKVPRWYYYFMGVSVVAPFFVFLLMIIISGLPSWLVS